MTARNVNLTDHLARFVDSNVATGRFQNASEVVREALRLLEQRQAEEALKLDVLRAAVEVGLEDVRRGRLTAVPAGEELSFVRSLRRNGSQQG